MAGMRVVDKHIKLGQGMDMYEILGEKKQTIKNYLSRHFEMEKDILDGVFKDSVTILAFDRGAIDLAGF